MRLLKAHFPVPSFLPSFFLLAFFYFSKNQRTRIARAFFFSPSFLRPQLFFSFFFLSGLWIRWRCRWRKLLAEVYFSLTSLAVCFLAFQVVMMIHNTRSLGPKIPELE
jgi:hypothetical protein